MSVFEKIKNGLAEALAYERGELPANTTMISVRPVSEYGATEIITTNEEFENALAPEEPNAVTYAAMEEAEQMGTTGKSYVRVKDLISALEE